MLQQKPSFHLSLKDQQHSKCGEIYFLSNNLCFSCVICELKTESFFEYRLHFEELHLHNFVCNPKYDKDESKEVSKETLPITNENEPTEDQNDPLYWVTERPDYEALLSGTTDRDILYNELNSLTTSPAAGVESCTEKSKKSSHITIEIVDCETNCSINSNIDENASSIDYNVDWNKPYKPTQSLLKRPYKPRNKPNTCSYCGRTFRRRYQLDTHLNIHTGEKPHQCEICGRSFRAMTTLQRHLNTHEKRNDHVCQFCDKSFTHRAALLSHESRHVQKRTIPCDECEKKFYTLNHCDTHKRRVHNKTNTALPSLPFACDICSNRYRSASMLSTHKLRKHLKTTTFKCEKCEKKFADKQKLEQHQSIHISKCDET